WRERAVIRRWWRKGAPGTARSVSVGATMAVGPRGQQRRNDFVPVSIGDRVAKSQQAQGPAVHGGDAYTARRGASSFVGSPSVRPSRRPLRGLLRVRSIFAAITKSPDAIIQPPSC